MIAATRKGFAISVQSAPTAIVRKRLQLDTSLYETLQILSLTLFETTPLDQLLTLASPDALLPDFSNQLNLFEC